MKSSVLAIASVPGKIDFMEDHNKQKKIALINDFTGFGRCSITVALPIISMLKVQCCPIPTAILSNHTGFQSFFFDDYTSKMEEYADEWKKLGLEFQGILSGFLGSGRQIRIVRKFFRDFSTKDTIIIVDPVMGDYGQLYPTYTKKMCEEMKKLVSSADILTPNLTEACFLTDTPYHEGKWTLKELKNISEKLNLMGPKKIVITGVNQGDYISNLCYEKDKHVTIRRSHRVGTSRSGTGDVFAAIVAADAVNGVSFDDSVKKASNFVKRCIERSIQLDLPITDGVCFEEILSTLKTG